MKKLFIAAACIATALSSFAHPETGKSKATKENSSTLNAVVAATGTKVTVTAISELPKTLSVIMKDEKGNELYQGKMTRGEYTQFAVFNLSELESGIYSIILQNGKEKYEKKIAVNTTKQLSVE